MNNFDFQSIAVVRAEEAASLLALTPPRPDGAYYLAGYAVECALKAVIAKRFGQHEWPEKGFVLDVHTHDLMKLVKLADLESDRARDAAANPRLFNNWAVVKNWTEQARYETHAAAKARRMVEAVTDPTDGVLPWIRVRW